jgi:hypothetical protein
MNLNDLSKSIEKAVGADRREESFFQYFDRLNHDGRLDMRACIFSLACILDFLDTQPWDIPASRSNAFLGIDTRPEVPKKETELKAKKKK